MPKEMLINVSEGEECRIALLEDGKLEELYMERTSSTSHVGNVYKGRVTNVEPSIQAAFVDFGLGRNGFLHISDLLPQYFGRKGEDVQEAVGRKMARRDRPPIQRCLRRGDEIVVQIIKEGIGTKGPTLSTYLSIPGRILVMMPGMGSKGVSRKIEDEEERRRLRKILDELKPPKDSGFIIRTAGVGKTKAEIERDLKYLTRLAETIKKKRETEPAPVELYTEGDLVTRSVRDVFTNDVDRIIVDNKEVAKKIKEFMKLSAPRGKNKVDLYEDPIPLFHKYGIEREIEKMYSRHVPLPSGGSLVIDSTEAIVAIDVNSGKFRDHSDAETTAFKTDMEAADEIPRQLRLRDLGGVIICDFIDLRFERHRRELERRLHDNLRNDRAKTKVLRMSQFGIIEMTRQRMRPSLKRSIYYDCPHCKGSGLVKTPESMSLDVMRRLAIALHDQRVFRIELSVSSEVAIFMLNKNRQQIAELEQAAGKRITIRPDAALGLDDHHMALFDARDGHVYIPDLGILPQGVQPPAPRDQQHGRQGRRNERPPRHQQATRGQPVSRRQEQSHEEDFEMDRVEDDVERRQEEHDESAAVGASSSDDIGPAPEELGDDADRESSDPPVVQNKIPDKTPVKAPIQIKAPIQKDIPRDEESEPQPLYNVAQTQEGGGRKRRRRRRGGRGRGGQNHSTPQHAPASQQPPSPGNQPTLAERLRDELTRAQSHGAPPRPSQPPHHPVQAAPPREPQPAHSAPEQQNLSRGRRGRGRRNRSSNVPADSAGETPAPLRVPPSSPAPHKSPIIDNPPVVRTGSTDRHQLHTDQPVNPDPPRRPRTYRDLDEIPEDFEDR